MPPVAPPTLDDLGIQGCLALAALLTAQERRIPVAPTRRLTLSMMHALREQGIIEAPWPDARWELDPTAEETPIEQIQWRYSWSCYVRPSLLVALEEYLEEIPHDDYGLASRVRLWNDLTASEAERFFESQLAKHHFDTAWASDLGFVIRDGRLMMPIAQWRYCCWAATRYGASIAQQLRGVEPTAVREGIYAELRKRALRLANGDWTNCAFVPFHPVPESAVSRLYASRLTRLGQAFWTLPAEAESLLISRAFRQPAGME
jgi:hypothetical protein